MDILLLLKLLWRKMWIIVSVPIVAGIAAYLFTENTIDQFRSSGQISTGFTTIDQIQITDERFNARDAEVKFNNLLASMNSGLVTNLLSYRLILHDIQSTETPYRMPAPEFASTPDEREQVKGLFRKKLGEFSPLSASDSSFALMRKFLNAYGYGYGSVRGGLSVRRIVNTDYVQVDFVSENPNLSAFAANAFCEEFIKYYNSIKSERSGESVDFLKQLADQKKLELDDKLEQLKIFKSSNSFLNVQQEGEAKLTQISELERRRDESRSKLYGLNLTIQRLETEIKNYGNNSSTSNNNNQKIIELRNRINKLNEKYITGGSSDSRLLDSLNNLRDQLQVMMNAIPQQTTQPTLSLYDLQSRLKDAQINHEVERTNLSQLEAKLRELQFSVSGYASKEAQVSAIQQEVDLASKEYLDAVNKYNEAKNKSLLNNTIRQTLTATPPVSPESSKRLIIIALATFASFGLCLFVVVVLELIDLTVRTPDKFKRIVGLPLAGPVNVIDTKNFNIRSFFGQVSTVEEVEVFKALMRKLRHEIESLNAKVILFTSPRKQVGKTFLIYSLSYVLSLINKRILIIDTNFKNNSLSQLLARKPDEMKVIEGRKIRNLLMAGAGTNEGGAENGSSGRPEFDDNPVENSYDLINPTKFKNVFIVGNAGGNDSPAEILSGKDFTNLIKSFTSSFDYILLEGAALNDYSDTKELVDYVDKVICVFAADGTINSQDRESVSYFKSLGSKFGGAILNKVDGKDLKL